LSIEGIRIKPRAGQTKREVLRVIKEKGPISLTEIWEATGINPNTIRGSVVSLTNSGLVERVGKGVYKAKSQ